MQTLINIIIIALRLLAAAVLVLQIRILKNQKELWKAMKNWRHHKFVPKK